MISRRDFFSNVLKSLCALPLLGVKIMLVIVVLLAGILVTVTGAIASATYIESPWFIFVACFWGQMVGLVTAWYIFKAATWAHSDRGKA